MGLYAIAMTDLSSVDTAAQAYADAQCAAAMSALKASLNASVSALYEEMKAQAQNNAPISPSMLSAVAAILAQVT